MAALLVFVVFLVAIAVSIPIGTSMILGSISPILLMHRGGSLVQLINNTFSGANSTPILASSSVTTWDGDKIALP